MRVRDHRMQGHTHGACTAAQIVCLVWQAQACKVKVLQLGFVTCSIAVGSAPEVRMKMVGMRAVVSGSTPFRVQGCPCVKAAPRLSPMYLWHPTNNLSSLKTCDSMAISFHISQITNSSWL